MTAAEVADPEDMRQMRRSLKRNSERFAREPHASATAVDLLLTLRRTATKSQQMAESYTRPFDLSPAKVVIVMALAAVDGQTLPQAEIARQLAVSIGNLTALLAALERAGIVRRKGDANDGRVTNVTLTAKGRALVRRFAPVHYRVNAAACAALTVEEQTTLISLLDKLRLTMLPEPA